MVLPSNVSFGTVVGRFLVATADSPIDPDRDPEGIGATDLVITFSAGITPKVATDSSASPPVTFALADVTASVGADGTLLGPDGAAGIRLVASTNTALNPTGWAWAVKLSSPTFPPLSFSFMLDPGATVDLATVLQVPANPGATLAAWLQAVADAQAARDAAIAAAASVPSAASLAATYAPKAAVGAGSVLGFIGDSLTSNGGGSNLQGFDSRSWPVWAQMFSGGLFSIGRIAAHGGYTSQQAASLLLPQITAATPPVNDGVAPMSSVPVGQCVVLLGTNDADLPSMIAGLTALYDGLTAAGITPIAATLPPRNDVSASTDARTLFQAKNRWISTNAAARGFPLLDFYGAPTLTDPATGGWRSGLNGDTVHPNDAGGKAMGIVAGAALATYLKPYRPLGPAINNDPDNLKSHPDNTLMLNLAAGDARRPDGWYLDPSDAAGTIALRTGHVGNRWSITRNTGDAVAQTDGRTTALVAGRTYLIRFRIDASLSGGNLNFGLLGDGYYAFQFGSSQDIPLDQGPVAFHYTAPAGLTQYAFVPQLHVQGASGAQTALSEFAIYDVTDTLATVST